MRWIGDAARLAERPRVAWCALAGAMVIAAAVVAWATRDTTLINDELFIFSNSHWAPEYMLSPHNEHLTLPVRLLYQVVFATVGPEHAAVQAVGIASVLLCVSVFFALARRRVEPLLALLASVLLLFLGLGWQWLLIPFVSIQTGLCVAAGLGALLALERDDRTGDALACGLVCLAVATFSLGLAFLVGVAVSVLLRADRWRRAWIFVVPLLLYIAWWAWAQKFDQPSAVRASNIPLVPEYFIDSLASVLGALAGLNELVGLEGLRAFDAAGAEQLVGIATLALRWALVALAVVALVVRIRRGRVPPSLWASLAVLTTYWLAGSLAQSDPQRVAESSRYVLPGAIAVLLVATDAARGMRLGRAALAIAAAVFAFALAANLHELRDASTLIRDQSKRVSSALAGLEAAERGVDPAYVPSEDLALFGYLPSGFPVTAGPYVRAVHRYGSPAYSFDELRTADEQARRGFDATLVRALDPRPFDMGRRPHAGRCTTQRGAFAPPAGDVALRSRSGGELLAARFAAAPFFPVGRLPADRYAWLNLPRDEIPVPWRVAIEGGGPVEVCPVRPG